MCGIVGKVYVDEGKKVTEAEIAKMCAKVAHRGPDDQGLFVDGQVGLGNRRLAIIDLSPAGHQPMATADRKLWITFNGEIHNFRDLRKRLEKEGIRFRSHSDTEVILYLYRKYGPRCLQYLRGQFALAIWDQDKRELFAARDRLGINPFKYYFDGKRFIFASELKAILTDPSIPREPDLLAIDEYLTYQYVPSPKTGFKGIAKLPPAHYLILKDGRLTLRKYWNLDYTKKDDLTEGEWIERIRDKLDEAVRLRMISDAPIGAFLSGGVDSSAIVATMAKASSRPVETFSIGFPQEDYDETPYARLVAERFGTNHHEFTVSPAAMDIFPKLVAQYEEPYADSSGINVWYLAELTRQYVTVALDGDGGDENFAGYPWYGAHRITSLYDRVPAAVREKVLRPVLLATVGQQHSSLGRRARIFLRYQQDHPGRRYSQYLAYFTQDEKEQWYGETLRPQLTAQDATDFLTKLYTRAQATDPVEKAMWTDIYSYLPDDLLVKVDIATMSHGLEARPPLLDHEFMEMVARIPAHLKDRYGQRKYIWKKALRGLVPDAILKKKKWGFMVPLEHWFRGELKDYVHDLLLSKRALSRGLLRRTAVEQLLSEHQRGIDHGRRIWALATLEQWFRTYIDGKS